MKKHNSKTITGRQRTLKIIEIINKHKIISLKELARYGATSTSMRRLVEGGFIQAVGSGIYASTKIDPFVATVFATAKYYSKAVISGITALQIHGLSNEYVEKIDIDIPRDTSVKNKFLNAHRVEKMKIVGIMKFDFYGEKIKIYNLERTLAEAYKLDPKGPLFFKALKRYVAKKNINYDAIKKFDLKLKTHVLDHIRQEVVSE